MSSFLKFRFAYLVWRETAGRPRGHLLSYRRRLEGRSRSQPHRCPRSHRCRRPSPLGQGILTKSFGSDSQYLFFVRSHGDLFDVGWYGSKNDRITLLIEEASILGAVPDLLDPCPRSHRFRRPSPLGKVFSPNPSVISKYLVFVRSHGDLCWCGSIHSLDPLLPWLRQVWDWSNKPLFELFLFFFMPQLESDFLRGMRSTTWLRLLLAPDVVFSQEDDEFDPLGDIAREGKLGWV